MLRIFLWLAISQLLLERQTHAISAGTPIDPNQFGYVLALGIKNEANQFSYLCSCVKVAPRAFLTHAFCTELSNQLHIHQTDKVNFNNLTQKTSSVYIAIEQMFPLDQGNLSLLVTKDLTPDIPIAKFTKPNFVENLHFGHELLLVGFGSPRRISPSKAQLREFAYFSFQAPFQTKRKGTTQLVGLTKQKIIASGIENGPMASIDDMGGALLVRESSEWTLLGIINPQTKEGILQHKSEGELITNYFKFFEAEASLTNLPSEILRIIQKSKPVNTSNLPSAYIFFEAFHNIEKAEKMDAELQKPNHIIKRYRLQQKSTHALKIP